MASPVTKHMTAVWGLIGVVAVTISLIAVSIVIETQRRLGGSPSVVEARVTNCWHYDSYAMTQGGCRGTDGNYPYTTQWALMLPCDNGTRTTGWNPAGTTDFVTCGSGHRRVASAYFLFR